MKRILFAAILLLLIAGCSRSQGTETQPEAKSGSADTASQARVQDAPACRDQCYEIEAFCQKDKFYACVQDGECKKIIYIDDCGGDYSCENTVFCSSPAEGKKIGIMVKDQLNQLMSIKGDVGDKFNLKFEDGTRSCSVTKNVKDMAIFECE